MSEQESETNNSVLNLSDLSPVSGSKKKRKRVGIGEGSGNGKTCGRGQKGAKSRSGYKNRAGFEGGQMPLHRRLPKRGFTSRKKVLGKNIFSLVSLQKIVDAGFEGDVTLDLLKEKGLVRSSSRKVKIVSGVALKSKFNLEAHKVSASVLAAVEQAGGAVKIL